MSLFCFEFGQVCTCLYTHFIPVSGLPYSKNVVCACLERAALSHAHIWLWFLFLRMTSYSKQQNCLCRSTGFFCGFRGGVHSVTWEVSLRSWLIKDLFPWYAPEEMLCNLQLQKFMFATSKLIVVWNKYYMESTGLCHITVACRWGSQSCGCFFYVVFCMLS